MLYPQNGDRIVAIDSVTSLQPMYTFSYVIILLIIITYISRAATHSAATRSVCVNGT